MAGETLAAHRLVLTSAEWALLVRVSAIIAPPGFESARVDGPALRAAARTLSARWVVAGSSDDPLDCVPVESIAVNLATVAAPVATVRVEVSAHEHELRAYFMISGPFGASLIALADGGVELSMFPAEALGRELVRAVPEPADLAPVQTQMGAALGDDDDVPLSGRLPLAALEGAGRVADATAVTATVDLMAEEVTLAAEVTRRTVGTLWSLVSGRGGDGVLVGQIVWLATSHGWIATRPDPDGTDRRMVALQPVTRHDFGVWVAPYLAEILEVAGEQSAATRS